MTDDLNSEIGKLHQHIEHVSHQVRDVKKGQDELHAEHILLRERVDHLEHAVSKDISDLQAHEKQAEIYREHNMDALHNLAGVITKLDDRFQKHSDDDERDRKEVIKGQRTTIRSILLAAATFATSAGMLLWHTGVLT